MASKSQKRLLLTIQGPHCAWLSHFIEEENKVQREVSTANFRPPDQTACSAREGLARNQREQPGQALPTYRALGLEQMLPGHLKKSLLHWNQPQSL